MGGAFGSGLMQGFSQQAANMQQRAQDDELKKMMITKYKTDYELQQRELDDADAASKGDISAIKRLVMKKSPLLGLLGLGQGGQGQDPRMAEGMNEQPPQQPTFPGSMTGLPQLDVNRLVEKEVYSNTSNPNDWIASDRGIINKGQAPHLPIGVPMVVPKTKGGYLWNQAQEERETIQYEPGRGEGGAPIRQGRGNVTGREKTGLIYQPEEIPRRDVEGADRSVSSVPVPKLYVQPPTNGSIPGQAPATPQQAEGNTVQLTIDTSKPGWRNEIDKTLDQVSRPKPSLGTPGMIQTKPPADVMLLEKPIDESEAPVWFNKNGENPPVGMKIREAQEMGFKKLDATVRDKYTAKSEVLRELDKFYPLMEKVYGPEKDASANTWGIKGRSKDYATSIGALLKTDTDAAELKAWWTSSLPMNLKNKGQVGSLSDRDVAMGAESQPNFSPTNPDTPDLAWRKYRNLYDYYNLGKSKIFEGKTETVKMPQPKAPKIIPAPDTFDNMLAKLKKTNPTTPSIDLEKYLKGKYSYGN